MSALNKHIGTEIDFPSMGSCVGGPEIGYLYGQVCIMTGTTGRGGWVKISLGFHCLSFVQVEWSGHVHSSVNISWSFQTT